MTETEREVAHGGTVLVVGVALLAGPIAVMLAAVNLFLWFVTALVLIVGGATMDSTRTIIVSDDTPKTNCDHCGARVPANQPRCEYCGEPLPDSTGYQQSLDEWGDGDDG